MRAGLVSLFWLTTIVPGFAVLQLWFPEDVRRGLLATLTWSYVLTVALLAPFVALAFTVHFSVQTAAACYFALVLGSAIIAVRRGGLGRLARLGRHTPWFEVGLVLAAIALTVPLGASAQSDSFAHSAKIRFIRDVGFYLQDAYSPLAVIETKWHVNVHHALFAIASWAGGAEPLELWFTSAWFFRLLALGGIGFLAATVFRSTWIGAVAMLGAVAVMGTKLTIVFPFSVTGFAVSAIVLALVVDLLERPSRRRYIRVVLCSVSLASLHVGTWFLALVCMAPVAAVWTVWRDGLKALANRVVPGLLIVATGVPFLLVSALQPNYVVAQQDELHQRMVRTFHIGEGWAFTVIDPTHYAWMLPLLASLVVVALVGAAFRVRVLLLAGIMAAAMIGMFMPGVFDLLVRFVPYWLVQRFRNFGEVAGFAIVAGGLAWMARPRLRTRWSRRALAVVVLCGSLAAFRENIHGYVLESGRQRRWLVEAALLQEAVQQVLPAHSLVAADPTWSLVLPTVHLARVMAADLHHANPADGGLLERYTDTQELLAPGTADDRRREIIAKHGIDYILVREAGVDVAPPRYDAVADVVAEKNGFVVYRVRG